MLRLGWVGWTDVPPPLPLREDSSDKGFIKARNKIVIDTLKPFSPVELPSRVTTIGALTVLSLSAVMA